MERSSPLAWGASMTADPGACRNCGAELMGPFCHQCGQEGRDPPGRLTRWFALLGGAEQGLEWRALRSLFVLLTRPGRLTRDYLDGRRIRYTSPIQIYLWCTAAFFLLHAYAPLVTLDVETGAVHSSLSAVSVGTRLSDETLRTLDTEGVTLEDFSRRFDGAVNAYLPVVLIGLVGATALLMALVFRGHTSSTHVIFALHWSAFYFVLEALRQMIPLLPVGQVPMTVAAALASVLYLTVAVRTVYGRSWLGSAVRAFVAVVFFSGLLGLWLASTASIAERLA